ncbi:MAG: DUF262 domain-containing HNH endonuclease family protein [Euryarchaeota archaeon]|nr:DUF262 domain-containing HNH endonuclease family protein [Euryarchaeota archaeon]
MSEIFSQDLKIRYDIPKYQREYVWRQKNWDELFDDLMEKSGHFLGSIICINRGNDSFAITPLEIVDGQQRLTTISLFYAAIYSKLLTVDSKDEDFITERNNLKFRLIQKSKKGPDDKNETKLVLSYQNDNYSEFINILNECGLSERHIPNTLYRSRKLYHAFKYYQDKIKDLPIKNVLDILEKINTAILVKIEVNSSSDAFILFESLNNRGAPLSAVDLIKNKALAMIESSGSMQLDMAFEKWNQIMKNLEDPTNQERFLRQYYNAFRFKQKVDVGIVKATRANLIDIYEKLIERQPDDFLKEMLEMSSIYAKFINPNEEKSGELWKGLMDMEHIGSAPSYAFLLYLLAERPKRTDLVTPSIDLLTKFFVRRNLTNYPATFDLDRIFVNLIKLCEDKGESLTFQDIQVYLTSPENCSTLDNFEQKLRGAIYDDNYDACRFVLTKLESSQKTRETFVDFWTMEGKRSVWTVEHIFPEGLQIPQHWVDMMADGDRAKANQIRKDYVHTIGNLTLTGYNPALSNSPFVTKRDKLDKDTGKPIGFKNGLFLNSWVAEKESWNLEDIKSRTDDLVSLCLDLFKFDLEKRS